MHDVAEGELVEWVKDIVLPHPAWPWPPQAGGLSRNASPPPSRTKDDEQMRPSMK